MRTSFFIISIGLASCGPKVRVGPSDATIIKERTIVLTLRKDDETVEYPLTKGEITRLDLDGNGINGIEEFPSWASTTHVGKGGDVDPHPNPVYPQVTGMVSELDLAPASQHVLFLITESGIPLNIWWEDVYSDEFKFEIRKLVNSKK